MFLGSIPKGVQAVFREHVKAWECSEVTIGRSGNFTVERCLVDTGVKLHSNDVGLRACAIGCYLTEQPFRLELRQEWKSELGWLEPYLDSPADIAATVMLCSLNPGPLTKIEGSTRASVTYYVRMRNAYKAQWPELHAQTKLNLEKLELPLASYSMADLVEFASSGDGPFICFDTGLGVESSVAVTHEIVFDWDNPVEYAPLDEDRNKELLDYLTTRDQWLYADKERHPELEENLRGVVQTTNRSAPVWIYSNGGSTRVSRPHQPIEPVFAPHLTEDDVVEGNLSLAPLTIGQFNGLRSQALKNIAPGRGMLNLAVLVDGYIIGAFAFDPGKDFGAPKGSKTLPSVYLMSDFALPDTPARASKLVVYAMLSVEARLLIERLLSKSCPDIATTAWSNKPVSMKYRGMLKMTNREDFDGESHKYQMEYQGKLGRWTLDEAYELWKGKHG